MLKKLLIFQVCLSFFSIPLFAQWQWAIRGGSVNTMQRLQDYNNITHMVTDVNGNIYTMGPIGGAGVKVGSQALTAYSYSGTANTTDVLICSFTPSGQLRWTKVIGGSDTDCGYSLKVDEVGHVYVSGMIINPILDLNPQVLPVHFDTDTILSQWSSMQPDSLRKIMYLVQYDTNGVYQWLNMPEPDTVSFEPYLERNSYPFRMDVDDNGNVYWFCNLKPGQFDWGMNNIIAQKGNYILIYNPQGQVTGYSKLDMEVGRSVDFFGSDDVQFARNHSTGVYYIAGTNSGATTISMGGSLINSNMYLAAFSPTGQLLWKKESGGVDIGSIESLELDDNGNLYLGGLVKSGTEFGGHTYASSNNSGSPFVSAFDSGGNHLWSNMAVVNAVAITYDVAVSDTEVAIAGYGSTLYWPSNTDSVITQPNQGYDAFLARFKKSNGELITMERTNTPFGGASYGNAIAAGPQNTYYLGGNFDQTLFLGQDTLYKVGSQRSFFLTKYECDVPEASMKVSGINATNTLNLTYTGDPADSVQWYLGDGTQVWGDSIQHSYAAKGKYRVCAMAYFACTEVTVCDSLVAGEIGLKEQNLNEVDVYPNPTNSLLYLENLPKHSSVKLYNLNGKLLLQEVFNDDKASLDLGQLSKGVYLLELQNSNGESDFRKVMKE